MGVAISLTGLFLIFIYILVMAISAIYVYKDAKKRGMNPGGWTLITFFAPFLIGLIIYLVCRKPMTDFQCPRCGNGLPAYAKQCDKCGHSLLTQCPECEFPVQRGWKSCPRCGSTLPENFEQPVRTYQKDNSGFVVIGIVVGMIVLALLFVAIPYSLFSSVDENHMSEGYSGFSGMYNITKEDFSENEIITNWIAESDKSDETITVLLSKSSQTCLVYVKGSDLLLNSDISLEYIGEEECDALILIDETDYEDKYGYDFFLFEFDMYEDTEVSIGFNGEKAEAKVAVTDADISINTWGGVADEK